MRNGEYLIDRYFIVQPTHTVTYHFVDIVKIPQCYYDWWRFLSHWYTNYLEIYENVRMKYSVSFDEVPSRLKQDF